MIKLTNLKFPLDHQDQDIQETIISILGIPAQELISWRVLRRSLDARKNRPLQRIYSVLAEVKNQEALALRIQKDPNLNMVADSVYQLPLINKLNYNDRPIIVGTGPSGIFAGLILAEAGLSPILLERGKPVLERIRDVNAFWQSRLLKQDSNVQFGEGGAGTFSDGKLSTRTKDKNHRANKILLEMVEAGAPSEIVYEKKPHVGTANLVKIVKNLRKKIELLGGEFRFNAKVTDLVISENEIRGVKLESGEEICSSIVVLAIGHSARDTFSMLLERGVKMAPKPFSVGFRIEHPQVLINKNQYGNYAGHPKLGAAEYQLAYHTPSGRTVYSFCMCPGGTVIGASSEKGSVVTNGMSQYTRDKANANSAIVAEVFPGDFGENPMDGFLFQRRLEQKAFQMGGGNFNAPVQLVGDFLSGTQTSKIASVFPSYLPGYTLGNLRDSLPTAIIKTIMEALPVFNSKIPGFSMPDAVLTGVETRTSSPLRILRGADFQSVSLRGVYPVGEGSGYAGGIMSSSIDGIKAAENIIKTINEVC